MRVTLLDCDGVLADWTSYLLSKVNCGVTIDDCTEFSLRNVLKNLKGRDIARRADAICSQPGFTSSQPLLPWAKELVELSMEAGDLVIATAPWNSKGWYDARTGWLKVNLGIHVDNVMVGRRKARLKGDLFVDDKPKNIIEWCEANPDGKGVLLAWPYNRAHEELPPNARRLEPAELIENLRAGRCGW